MSSHPFAANNDPLAKALDEVASSSPQVWKDFEGSALNIHGGVVPAHGLDEPDAMRDTLGDPQCLWKVAPFGTSDKSRQTILDLQEKVRALTLENEGAKGLAKDALEREARLREAAQKVIDMNRQQGIDQYGDADKAEGWACVMTLRAAMAADTKEGA